MINRHKNQMLPLIGGILLAAFVEPLKSYSAEDSNTRHAGETESIPQSAYCTASTTLGNSPSWNGYSVDMENSRFQPAKSAGIVPADVPKLKLKWAFGFPGVTTSFGTPTVVGGWLYIGSADGTVYALNAISGSIWFL